MKLYVAFRSVPDYYAGPAPFKSVHLTLDGAIKALYPTKDYDFRKWPGRDVWEGPDDSEWSSWSRYSHDGGRPDTHRRNDMSDRCGICNWILQDGYCRCTMHLDPNAMNRVEEWARLREAEQRLCRAADDYVWNPTDETMEQLRLARGEWQAATGIAKLAAHVDAAAEASAG